MAATVTPARWTRPRRIGTRILGVLLALLAVPLVLAGATELSAVLPDVLEWYPRLASVVELVPGLPRLAAMSLIAVSAGAVVLPLTRYHSAALALPPAVIGGLAALIGRR